MFKTKYLSIAATIIITAVIAGYFFGEKPRKQQTSPPEKLTIGSPRQEISSLVYLAKELRYFEKVGLDVEIKEYQYGFTAIEAVLKNDIDIAFATDFAFVASYFGNKEPRILCSIGKADVEELVARKDSGISKIEDLKNKKIGVRKNSSAEFHLATFLLFNGIPLDTIQIVDLPPPELVEAVKAKRIDATVIWPPHAFRLQKALGKNAVSWSAQSGQPFFWLAITTNRVLNGKPTAVKNFLACLAKAETFLKENEAQARQIVRNYLNLDSVYMDYHWKKQVYAVELAQSLLLRLEDEARWKIENQYVHDKEVPNYLNAIVMDMLKQVNPESITIIH